jgi:hypothetical protein
VHFLSQPRRRVAEALSAAMNYPVRDNSRSQPLS